MQKTFVLDTNVLIQDPNCFTKFGDNFVVVPIFTLEELDKHKSRNDDVGKGAREATRNLDSFSEFGCLSNGVKLESGVVVSVIYPKFKEDKIDLNVMDNKIILTAVALKDEGKDVVLISNDINMRVKSEALGIRSEKYESNRVEVNCDDEAPEILLDPAEIDDFYSRKYLFKDLEETDLNPNDFVVLKSNSCGKSALAKVSSDREGFLMHESFDKGVWGIKPKNKEQRHAMDLLMDDTIQLVCLTGISGTGKTLMSIAASMSKVTEENVYESLIVSRATVPVARDIGFMPGDKNSKMDPWMAPIWDNLDYLFSSKDDNKANNKKYQYLIDTGLIQIECLSFMRGRSLSNKILILDECQNLSTHEAKTLLTRAGENCKIILLGDIRQIDNPYLDSENNGLAYVIKKFRGQSIFGHINLVKGERSKLAELSANLL